MLTQCSTIGVGEQQLEDVQNYNVPWERRNEGWSICALYAKKGLQSEVLYCDDKAVLTMQCDAQSYF